MKYDLTLKELFQQTPRQLLKILIGKQPKEILTVEYPVIKDRRPDLVTRLEDDTIYHLELQSDNDNRMIWRMLEYFTLIKRQYQRPIMQQVLYVGNDKMKMLNQIAEGTLQFKYELIDIRQIDCTALLKSSSIEDNILAILCRMENSTTAIQTVLQRIARLDTNARRDALEKIQILMGLRGIKLRKTLNQEVRKMEITIDVKDTIWYQDGKLEGESLILQRQLVKRFGTLPHWATDKIDQAQSEQLEQWSLQILDARTLEEVFH